VAITSGTAPYIACQYAEAAANGSYPAGDITITSATSAPASGPSTSTYWIQVTVSESLNTTFLRLITGNPASATVSAQSTAAIVSNGVAADAPCMYILGSTGNTFTVGNGAVATGSGCGIYINSSCNNCTVNGQSGLYAAQVTARVNAPVMSIVGSDLVNNGGKLCTAAGSSCTTLTPQTGASAAADPFASVAQPSSMPTCTAGSWSSGGTNTTVGPVSPATSVCYNGFSMSNGQSLTLNPGVYYINGGEFSIQGGGTLTATSGVTIFLTGTGTNYANYAYVNIANGVTVNMTAQTTGPYEGILFFQDRCPSCTGSPQESVFAGGSSTTLTGSIYMKNSAVEFDNGSTESSTMALVVGSVNFEGGTTVLNQATSQSQTGLPVASNRSALVQ
jgi:hypothetical protein